MGTLLILSLVGIIALIVLAPPWPEPVPGVDLTPTMPPIKPEEMTADNGMFHLNRLPALKQSATAWPNSADIKTWLQSGGPTANHPGLLASMEGPRAAFELCRQASSCSMWRVDDSYREDTDSVVLVETMNLAKLAGFEAARMAEQEEWKELEILMADQIRVGCRSRNGGALIHLLLGTAVNRLAMDSILSVSAAKQVPEATLNAWQQVFVEERQRLAPVTAHYRNEAPFTEAFVKDLYWDEADREEVEAYFPQSPLNALLDWPRIIFKPFGSNPAASTRHLKTEWTYAIDRANKDYDPAPNPWDEFKDSLQNNIVSQLGSDPLARIAVVIESGVIPDHLARTDRIYLSGAACALAIFRFERKHGSLPGTLRDLVPEMLPATPEDLFNPGYELLYRASGNTFQLYSVGANQVDDGCSWQIHDGILPTDVIIWPPNR